MLDTYTGRENETLEVLKIYPMKSLALEEKEDDDMFEEYDANQITVKIIKWQNGLSQQGELTLNASNMKIQKDLLMRDFMAILSKEFNIS